MTGQAWASAVVSARLGVGLAAGWSGLDVGAVQGTVERGATLNSSVTRRATPEQQPAAPPGPTTWRDVTPEHIERDLDFDAVPPDSGVFTPVAAGTEELDENTAAELALLRRRLAAWPPGKVADPVQRARNLLGVPAVVDLFQMNPLERWVPREVHEQLLQSTPPEDLPKILYWIAVHPDDGSPLAGDELQSLGLGRGPGQVDEVRHRAAIYAVKLLGRLIGKVEW